jgi:uncharacterized Zn finger protein
MPLQSCPTCGRPTPWGLAESRAGSRVNYYRCDQCGHVWSLRRDAPGAKPHTIVQGATPPPPDFRGRPLRRRRDDEAS